jgi:hypothetical protein
MEMIIAKMTILTFKDGAKVINAGTPKGESLYVVVKGSVTMDGTLVAARFE